MTLESYLKVYDEYFKLARRVIVEIVEDYDLAGDVAQEVFTEMFMKKESLDESKIKYWVVLNANRRAIDCMRKLYKCDLVDVNQEMELRMGAAASAEELVIRNEAVRVKKSALEQLKGYNQMWYDILIRKCLHGESYQKLALTYGMKVSTVHVHVCRARKWLDRKFYELYGE